jgi:hypothetical protein
MLLLLSKVVFYLDFLETEDDSDTKLYREFP